MRFYIKLNMPTGTGHEVTTLTVDHPAESCEAFMKELGNGEFICLRQVHRYKNDRGEIQWRDSGEVILNTYRIGSVKEFVDLDEEGSPQRQYVKKRMIYR